MGDYPLQSSWPEIDASAQAFKNGVTVQTTVQAKKTSAMTAPVGVDANGKLWTTPGENNPGGDTPTGGGGYVIPDGGIPATDLSQEVRDQLREQIVYNFMTPAAYEDFVRLYGGDRKRGDIVIILDTDGNGKTAIYQLGKNSLDPFALVPIMEIEPQTGEAGADAMIWATRDAPNSGRFAVSNLSGPAGAVPVPGHMVISSHTGLGYFVTDVDGGYVTVGSHTVQVRGTSGQDGQSGRDAVIWYTNGGPHNNIFPIQSLMGPMNATPVPGHMIISNYTGLAYFITEIDGDVAVFGDYTVQVKSNTQEIVSAVIAALPVYGGETQ